MDLPRPLAVVPVQTGVDLAPAQLALSGCTGLAELWSEPGDPRPLTWLVRHVAALGAPAAPQRLQPAESLLEAPRPEHPDTLELAGFPGSQTEFGEGAAVASPLWAEVFAALWRRFCADHCAGAQDYAEVAAPWLGSALEVAGLAPREVVVIEDPRRILARLWRQRHERGYVPPLLADPANPWGMLDQLERSQVVEHLARVAAVGRGETRCWLRVEDAVEAPHDARRMLDGWLREGRLPPAPTRRRAGHDDLPANVRAALTEQLGAVLEEFGYAR